MDYRLWIQDERTIEKSRRSYAHFDVRTDLSKMSDYVLNPSKISRHSFYPFIHYTKRSVKYSNRDGKEEKKREIYYAAHADRCIFQFYSYLINDKYNEYVLEHGINSVAVAYRNNLGESNITSSKRAYDFIKSNGDCYVIIGDFTGFFDCLDHKYLKQQLQVVLDVDRLPDDFYAIFKNITKYSSVERTKLLELNHLGSKKKDIRALNKKDVVIDKLTYKNNKNIISKNTEGKGIPQGSPISAVLSNVYMVELDQMINDYVNDINGMYIRYSDDFIVVIPNKFNDYQPIHKILSYISEVPNLVLKRQKTQIFSVKNNIVTNIGKDVLDEANSYKNTIDFLGFSFDGGHVRMRSKTVGKYYYRMYRRAKTVVRNQGRGMKKLYSKYSYKGANENQNFFTYVNNAVKIYGKNELIGIDFKHHMQKIRKGLKKSSTCR